MKTLNVYIHININYIYININILFDSPSDIETSESYNPEKKVVLDREISYIIKC